MKSIDKRHHVIVGILIILAGIIIMLLLQRHVSSNYPWLHQAWPLIFITAMLVAFMNIRNPVISVACAMLALFAFVSYVANINFLRATLGLACIGFGLMMIYHLVAQLILERSSKQ